VDYYVLQNEMKLGAAASRNMAHQALGLMRKHTPTAPDGKPIDWTLVDRVEDLPEGAPTVEAAAVLHRVFDKEGGGIPLCQRQGDELVLIPQEETEEEREQRVSEYLEQSDALRKRLFAARHILIVRREDRLPKLRVPERDRGTRVAMEKYDAWRERRKPLEDKITKKLDEAQKRSSTRLRNQRDDWREPLDEAIVAAGITEDEIADEIRRAEAREAEVERALAADDAK
jgi:hypothetical protein